MNQHTVLSDGIADKDDNAAFSLSGSFHGNLQSQTKATNHLGKAFHGSKTYISLRKNCFLYTWL